MMTNATAALDPLAAATAIAYNARRQADRTEDAAGMGAIAALTIGIVISLIVIAVMVTSPATIPMWCAAHGGWP